MEIQIGKNIRSLRCRRLVSQEDLAQTMGVTVQAISKWETGKANPDLQLLPKLAEYFGVTIDSLFAADAADVFEEGKLYSAARARLVNPAFIVRARKL